MLIYWFQFAPGATINNKINPSINNFLVQNSRQAISLTDDDDIIWSCIYISPKWAKAFVSDYDLAGAYIVIFYFINS